MITSTSNPRIKDVIRLRDKSSERRERGLFIVEGRRMAEEIPVDRIEALYAAESFDRTGWRGAPLNALYAETVSDAVMAKMADTVTPQGILAVVRQERPALSQMEKGGLILLLDRIQDPGNLGTIIRTAEACGADGILCDAGTADLYSPKVVRSTMGALFRVPVVVAEDLEESLRQLKAGGYTAFAAHLQGSTDYRCAQWPEKTVLMIGNEANGLTDQLTACADSRVIIPMQGSVESLNASVAAALLMFEWRRCRDVGR